MTSKDTIYNHRGKGRELGDFYLRHLSAMTGEQLITKSDIACELGARDQKIVELEKELAMIAWILEPHYSGAGLRLEASWMIDRIASYLESAAEDIDEIQAKLDAVMLEYCPEEMTEEQLERWGNCQEPVNEQNDL